MNDERFTLTAPHRHAQVVRSSHFVAHAVRVDSPAEAAAFLARVRDPLATHNCFAWRIGERYRFADDGEPAGTAGQPILRAIDGQNLDRVAVLVARHFGGIKLGRGGLARAYGGCAAECLRQAPKQPYTEIVRVAAELPAALVPLLRARLRRCAASVLVETFTASQATLTLAAPRAQLAELHALLADLSRGRATLRILQ
jgi:uncharacterized YigZ family protein